jgi:hypothetical protein
MILSDDQIEDIRKKVIAVSKRGLSCTDGLQFGYAKVDLIILILDVIGNLVT